MAKVSSEPAPPRLRCVDEADEATGLSSPQMSTILFDCDNTLVMSEKLAFEGCAELINRICVDKGKPLDPPFTGPTLEAEFVGFNFRGMVSELRTRYGLPITDDELDGPAGYVRQEEDVVIAQLVAKAEPCDGANAALERLSRSDAAYRFAIVSSSAARRVRASIDKVDQAKYFPADAIFSAATSLPTPTSKPNPAVYLFALERLGVKAEDAVAIEDSKTGTTAGARANIPVIGYLGAYPPEKRAEMEKVLREAGAKVIMHHWDDIETCLEQIAEPHTHTHTSTKIHMNI